MFNNFHHTVPTNLESLGESGNWRDQEKSGNFVGAQGKIACIMRLTYGCCNIVSARKRDELFWIIVLVYFIITAALCILINEWIMPPPVAIPRRCLTLSNPVPWQSWMAAYLGYTLRMKTLFRGWPVMVNGWRGGLVVWRLTCDLVVAGSRPGHNAAA